MTQQELLERMKRGIAARLYPGISAQNEVKESIAAICAVVAEALAEEKPKRGPHKRAWQAQQ